MLQQKLRWEKRQEKNWKGQINEPWWLTTGDGGIKDDCEISGIDGFREELGGPERKREVKEEQFGGQYKAAGFRCILFR